MSHPIDPAKDGAQMAFDGRMSYGDYLSLDRLLTAQTPCSEAHDEMLFIIQHQTSELWMRLVLHELQATRKTLQANKLRLAFKMLSRVARIFEQLNNAWDVLRTMTPSDYTSFRDALGQSSGFQSFQYRQIEFLLGNRNPAMLLPHAHRSADHAALSLELTLPSLYDVALQQLAQTLPECPITSWREISAGLTPPMMRSPPLGPKCIKPQTNIGNCMSWQKNWWIAKITFAAGGSITSPPSSG